MYRCLLCRFLVEADDARCPLPALGICICVRCFAREVGDEHPMSKALRREIEMVMSGA